MSAPLDDPTYQDYLDNDFVPVLCNGYHPKYNPRTENPENDYKAAKKAAFSGWNSPDYVKPTLDRIAEWERSKGWLGWRLPNGIIAADVEDSEAIGHLRMICQEKQIVPAVHKTNNGIHVFFQTMRENLPAASKIYTECGVKVTYRVGGKNYLILAPTNGRTWEIWKSPQDLPEIPAELLPYDRKSPKDVLNCLSRAIRRAYRGGHLAGYEDLDAAFMVFLISCRLEKNQIHHAFQIVFGPEYDERQTELMFERTQTRLQSGDPVLGTGTFMQRVKEQCLDEVGRFVRELQSAGGISTATVEEEWPDPVSFDNFSLLPNFPVEALTGIGREIVEAVAEVYQVDPALSACLYLAMLSTCCAKKARVDLISHAEPLNLYFCPVYNSGNRKSSTDGAMTSPLYGWQKTRQEELEVSIRDARNAFTIKEKRLDRIQKMAAQEDDPEQRRQLEKEAAEVARDMGENPVPNIPVFVVDDVTPEKLGVLMADNGEIMAVITPEGGLFEIMAGRYSNDGVGNIDLFLKAHAGDPWSNHRIARESKTMRAPALTLCLAVQGEVLEEIGKNKRFRGKGLLARFLFSMCKSRVGYRARQTNSIAPLLFQKYRDHVFSMMQIPFSENYLRLTPDAQATWDEFYDDVEREMRPEGSLFHLQDWGSKLPGAVARIAGLLHLAENGGKGLSMPISVNIVRASCVIGGYFKEHPIAVFGLMQEDPRLKLARQIRDYIRRQRPETIKVRDVMRHTNIALSEEVESGLKILSDRGYLREEPRANHPGAGRPSGIAYRVNPKFLAEKCQEVTD